MLGRDKEIFFFPTRLLRNGARESFLSEYASRADPAEPAATSMFADEACCFPVLATFRIQTCSHASAGPHDSSIDRGRNVSTRFEPASVDIALFTLGDGTREPFQLPF
jgi:hypothetical protein